MLWVCTANNGCSNEPKATISRIRQGIMGKVIPYLEEHAFLERVDTLYDPIYISSPVELAYTHPILGGFLYGPEEAERRLKVMEKSNPVKRSPSGDVETEYRHFAQGLRQ